jgi:uncharacterized protein (TIGR03437 family)
MFDMRQIKKVTAFMAGCALLVAPLAYSQSDSAGTSQLSGNYYFRYVGLTNVDNNGNIGNSGVSITGSINFDGKGNYSITNALAYDSTSTASQPRPFTATGTYAVSANGLLGMDNPYDPQASGIYGTVSAPVVLGSSTEDIYGDLFVAVQAPTSGITNSSLNGQYQVSTMDFLQANNTYIRNAWFTMNASGSGSIATFTANGSANNINSSAAITQTVSGATYSLTNNGTGMLIIPAGSGGAQGSLISGTKNLYISADGSYIIGGSTSGLDIIFGFKALSGSVATVSLNGTYFAAGMDADLTDFSSGTSFLDAYYGSFNAGANGAQLWHQRLNPITNSTYDLELDEYATLNSVGVSDKPGGTFVTNGQAFFLIGKAPIYTLSIGVKAPNYQPTGSVWISPLGIVNAANYTPITAPYGPGELVNIYGTFTGATTQTASSGSFPTSLGGAQVSVNGRPASIYSVSPNLITALIPYGTTGNTAAFQVTVNGTQSNQVSVYSDSTGPGVYTVGQNGIGQAAILHANFSPVSSGSPANSGETVQLFLNGLGTVTPAVADGAAAPSSPLSNVDSSCDVYIDGMTQASVSFCGLAPGFVGLYQINFVVPSGLNSGNHYVGISTDNAYVEMSTIPLSGRSSAVPGPNPMVRRPGAMGKRGMFIGKASSSKAKARRHPITE